MRMEPCVGGKRWEYRYGERSGVAIEKDHRVLVLVFGCINVGKRRIDFFPLNSENANRDVRRRKAEDRDHRPLGQSRKTHPASDWSRKSSQAKDSLLPGSSFTKTNGYHRTDAERNLRLRRQTHFGREGVFRQGTQC